MSEAHRRRQTMAQALQAMGAGKAPAPARRRIEQACALIEDHRFYGEKSPEWAGALALHEIMRSASAEGAIAVDLETTETIIESVWRGKATEPYGMRIERLFVKEPTTEKITDLYAQEYAETPIETGWRAGEPRRREEALRALAASGLARGRCAQGEGDRLAAALKTLPEALHEHILYGCNSQTDTASCSFARALPCGLRGLVSGRSGLGAGFGDAFPGASSRTCSTGTCLYLPRARFDATPSRRW